MVNIPQEWGAIFIGKNCFLGYFGDPAPYGAVIYVVDIPFWYSEKGDMYIEVLDNPSGNIFLATSRDNEFLLSYRNTVLHTSTESRSSSQNYVKYPSSSTTTHKWLPPWNPSDPLHPTYCERRRDAQAEYVSLIKTTLWNIIQNVNFVDPMQTRKAHEALMYDTNKEGRYIGTKYSVQIDLCSLSGTNSF